MPLTSEQKAAGRAFRAALATRVASLNESDPPHLLCSPWSPPYLRHECEGQRAGTVAMALREQSEDSPDGLFRFTWLEGRCHHCQVTARSSSGYLTVLAP